MHSCYPKNFLKDIFDGVSIFDIYQSLTNLSKRVLLKITTASTNCIYNLILPFDFLILITHIKIYVLVYTKQFARIHTSSLINIEKILNRSITKFYNGDDVIVIAAELRLTKTRSTSFYKKHNLL